MAEREQKSSQMSWITTGVLILGVAGVFVYKFMFATPTDPLRKQQMDPEGGMRAYLATVYGFLTNTKSFYDIEKVVPKEDYEWFQKNYSQYFHDTYNLRTGIDPNEGDAVAKIGVMREIIESGPDREHCEIVSKNIMDNQAELVVRQTMDQDVGYADYKVRLVREGKFWKVKDFAGGKLRIQNIEQPGDVTYTYKEGKGEGEGTAGASGAAGAPGGPQPGAAPGAMPVAGAPAPPQAPPPEANLSPISPEAGMVGPVAEPGAGQPVAAPVPPVSAEPAAMGPASPEGMAPGVVPGAPPAGMVVSAVPPQSVPGGVQPVATSAAKDMAAYMKELDAEALKATAPGGQPVRPVGYQPGYAPVPAGPGVQPAVVAGPAAAGVKAPEPAVATPAVPAALTVADADRLVQQAREDWNARKYQDSLTKAQQALDVYRKQLGDNDPKTVQLQDMVNAGRQMLNR